MPLLRSCLLATLVLLLTSPVRAADPVVVAPSGAGTVASPYLVDSLPNLAWISANSSSWGAVFLQGKDIDASATATWNSGAGLAPIGNTAAPFTGTYQGAGHALSGLAILRPSESKVGLFGATKGSKIGRLRVLGAKVQGYAGVGALIGSGQGDTVSGCTSSGTVSGYQNVGGLIGSLSGARLTGSGSSAQDSGGSNVGGLVGSAVGSFLDSCVASGSVVAGSYAGGLAGTLVDASTLRSSHATGTARTTSGYGAGLVAFLRKSRIETSWATGNVSGGTPQGGLVGQSSQGMLLRCFATGSLKSTSSSMGGLLGYAGKADTVELCYASGAVNGTGTRIGGLVGYGTGTVLRSSFALGAVSGNGAGGLISGVWSSDVKAVDCYWNATASGLSGTGLASGATGLKTAQMMDSAQLRGLGSFETEWTLRQGRSYPGLRVLDNAPYAVADTLATGSIFGLSRLLANDVDIETDQAGLVVRLESATAGATDSVTALDLTGIGKPGDTVRVRYRVGEVRLSDTLWGNGVGAVLVRDPAILVKTLEVYENGSVAALAARNSLGLGMDYAVLEAPENGSVVFRGDSLVYTPRTGFVGSDALRYRVVMGADTAAQTVAVKVNGPTFALGRVFLGRKAGSLALNRITPAPVAWKLGTNASWFSVTPAAGSTGAELTVTALSDDTLGEVRQGLVTLTAGAYTQTFQVIQTPLRGAGSEADPFLISSYADLKAVRHMDLSKVYRVTADIDASASKTENDKYGFAPIGYSSAPFTGTFHGGNFAIEGLSMGGYSSNRALFGYARGARLDSIRLTGLHSVGDYGYEVGGLIGNGVRDTILDCSVEGRISGYGYLGGLAGRLDSSVLRRSVAKVAITGGSYSYGGLVGDLSRSQMDSCMASGRVEGNRSVGGLVGEGSRNRIRWSHSHGLVKAQSYGGGLVGESDDDTLLLSYATGAVSGGSSLGGLIGDGYGSVVHQCYAAVRLSNPGSGGLIGNGYYDSVASSVALGSSSQALSGGLVGSSLYGAKIGSSYWDTALTKVSGGGSGKGTGLSRADLMNPAALAGLGSFATQWILRPDSTYPGLRAVDNAPFSFPDTLVTGQHFETKRLLANDFDIAAWRTGLVVRIDSLAAGTTDSSTQVIFPVGAGNHDTLALLYRVGRLRAGDTLWGSQSQSLLVANPRILARALSVYQDSSATVPAARAVDGSTLSYGLLHAPAHGTALFRGDSLHYAPAAGYAGPDSLRYFATDGLDTNSAWVKVTVTGPQLKSTRLILGMAASSVVTDSVGPAPVAWTLSSNAAWLAIAPGSGKGAAAVVYSALTANATGKPRTAVVTLRAGTTVQTLAVVQNSLQGTGSEADPFLLTNYADLEQVEAHGLSKAYRLAGDIDASPSRTQDEGFKPIGQDSLGFTGSFHGAGHLIRGLSIRHNNDGDYGLFRLARNAVIDSLGLVDVRILTALRGYDFYYRSTTRVGALAGWADSTRISQCYASGQISGGYFAGGLVGQASRHSRIRDSYAAVTISGEGRNGYGGGLVGRLELASLAGSFAVGALEPGVRTMGGLVGYYGAVDSVRGCFWDSAATGATAAGGYGYNGAGPFGGRALSRTQMKDAAVLDSMFGSLAPQWTLRPDSTHAGLRALDNAPFAVPDTFTTGQHFVLSRLAVNDFDVETYRQKLVVRVLALDAGVTDSVKLLDFSRLSRPADTVRVRYQVGEVRATDTLWGSVVTSLLRLDPRIVADSFTVLTDSSIKVRAGLQTSGVVLSYGLAVAPLHGTVSFAGDSLKFVPTAGFAGTDSLLLRAFNGTDTATSWVRVRVVGPLFATPRTVLGNTVGMKVSGSLDRDPKSWTLSHAATWYSVTRGTGNDAAKLEFTVLAANPTGRMRIDTLILSSGPYRQTMVVAQTTMMGAGTSADPYRIATLRDLKLLEATGLDKEYRLVADLNLAGNAEAAMDTALLPIGSEATPFVGRFHGAGHMIRNLGFPGYEDRRGLFGATSRAVIDSLGLVAANFRGGNFGGALVAKARNTRIEKVFVTGVVSVYDGGALVGEGDSILMRHCYSTAAIEYADADAGGLAGYLSNSRIESSWSMSIGKSTRNRALVYRSRNDTLVGCYWNKQTGAQSDLDGNDGTVSDDRGLTLAQLKDPANLAGLGSFDTTWRIRPGITLPTLRGMYSPPQGFPDSLHSGSTFRLARLLENDASVEEGSTKLAFRLLEVGNVISSEGDTMTRTDSVATAVFSPWYRWIDAKQAIRYQPGDVVGNDTIWGSPVRSTVTINPLIFLAKLDVLADSFASDQLASEMNNDAVSYTQLVPPLHGVAVLRNDSLVYTPAKGFAGRDSLRVQAVSGQDTSYNWVRLVVKGAKFGRRFAVLRKAAGSRDTVSVSEAPVAWSVQTSASWLSVAPASGTGAGRVVFTASEANGSSRTRLDTVILNYGTYQDTLLVYQTGMEGTGSEADPYRIATYADLKLIEVLGLDRSYRLVANLDATSSRLENRGRGFKPLGQGLYDSAYDRLDDLAFTGRLHGGGHSIRGLFIDRSEDTLKDYEASSVGLFHLLRNAKVDSLKLLDVSITGAYTSGALAAYAEDSTLVRGVSVTGAVTSHGGSYQSVGGLIGYMNRGRVVGCEMKGTVTAPRPGYYGVGGLVGYQSGSALIDSSSAEVTVLADSSSNVGGLVGSSSDSVRFCTSRGLVRGGDNVGGLVGESRYGVIESSASGAEVVGQGRGVGGLAGSAASVEHSYATGSVQGSSEVGGLVGRDDDYSGSSWMGIRRSYATGSVRGADMVGGLIGRAGDLRLDTSYATGSVHSDTGLVAGLAGEASEVGNCYAAGRVTGRDGKAGGLVGKIGSYTDIANNLWDKQASGRTNALAGMAGAGGMRGLATAQLTDPAQVAGLGSLATVWRIREGATYPGLRALDNAPFAFADTLRAGLNFAASRLLGRGEDLETGKISLTARPDSVVGGTLTATGVRFPTGAVLGDSLRVRYRIGEVRPTDTLWGNRAWVTVRLRGVAFVGLDSLPAYGDVFTLAAEIPGSGAVAFSVEGSALSLDGAQATAQALGTATLVAASPGLDTVRQTVRVVPRTISVTALPRYKTQGEEDPALVWSVTGLVGSDALTGALARVPGDTVGSYAITQGTLAAGSNYFLKFVPGVLSIEPKPLGIEPRRPRPANPGVLEASIRRSYAARATMPGQGSVGIGVSGHESEQAVDLLLSAPGRVAVLIADNLGVVVIRSELDVDAAIFRTLTDASAGRKLLPLSWNLRAANGVPVPVGVYLWKILVRTQDGQSLETVKKLGVHTFR